MCLMKALMISLLTALLFTLVSASANAAIPAPTRTPVTLTATATSIGIDSGMAIALLFIAGVILAGVVAVLLVRRGGSASR
jgi:hypothetical protein